MLVHGNTRERYVTLPYQRTVAVLNVREFLVRLLSPYVENGLKRIPKEVRKEARDLLKHFPNAVDIYCAGMDCPDVFDDKEAIAWVRERERGTARQRG